MYDVHKQKDEILKVLSEVKTSSHSKNKNRVC